ncbi:hypothetical protein BDR22DRAFT_910741 [Usnea florida]
MIRSRCLLLGLAEFLYTRLHSEGIQTEYNCLFPTTYIEIIELQSMEHHHSTLELVKNDDTARAPERDWDATALELDTGALAPQVVLDTSPQVVYDNILPELHSNTENTTKERISKERISKERISSQNTPKPWLKLMIIIIASVITVAIAVGVGVGVGTLRHREYGSHGLSTTTNPPTPSPTAPQNHTTEPISTTQYILNDTSLAAIVLSDGDRHVFFQDSNGSIRHAIRSASENQWTISISLNLSSRPKNHTPLAANGYSSGFDSIGLLYVSENHVLVSAQPIEGFWSQDSSLGNRSTAVDTRSLSFWFLPGIEAYGNTSNVNKALLLYENSTGQVSALLNYQMQWADITSQRSRSLPNEFKQSVSNGDSTTLYESPLTNATLSVPFISTANLSQLSQPKAIGALFYSPNASIVEVIYDVNASGPGIFSGSPQCELGGNESGNSNAIHRSDIASFGTYFFLWINGTQPVQGSTGDPGGPEPPSGPNSLFPFARLASATSSSTTFLYHQMNGTTFAEEQWSDLAFAWGVTEYINLSDLNVQPVSYNPNPQ